MEGYIYILTNPSMPGLLKIGSTKRSPEERKRELSKPTGVPVEFVIAYEIFTINMSLLENYIHIHLDQFRVNRNREFFRFDLSKAIEILQKRAEALRLDSHFKAIGLNEMLDTYEAIEILGRLQIFYPEMIRKAIMSVRIYQTRLRCYLELTEEEVFTAYRPTPLINQKIQRVDLGFIMGDGDDFDSLLFMPSILVSENARIFIEDFDDYSKLVCCSELFTDNAANQIQGKYFSSKKIN